MAYEVYVTFQALKNAIEHSFNSLSDWPYIEKGGFLIGAKNDGEQKIYLLDSCEAPYAKCYATSMKITPDDWAHADKHCAEYEKKTGVSCRPFGWYHSHPSYGVFMSPYDSFIQEHFFNKPWNVALVIDPTINHFDFFGWKEKLGKVEPLPFRLFVNKISEEPPSLILNIEDEIWHCKYKHQLVDNATSIESQILSYLLPVRMGVGRKFVVPKQGKAGITVKVTRAKKPYSGNE